MRPYHYRPDIDGLRCIAVLAVVMFHAFPGHLNGGFIGVDVFFVISGYLITGHLYSEGLKGHVSIANFYERRVRRIAPALLTVLLVSSIASWFLLFPNQYVGFAKSLLSAEFFVSNIWFYKQAGYFAATGGILPLLHTWSLAVEEQFYIAIPLLVAILARKQSMLRVTLSILALGSFALSCVGVFRSPGATFFLIPTRAWELLVGSLIAIDLITIPHRWREGAAMGGMAFLLGSTFVLNENFPFPGPLALLPCVATGLLIASGANTAVARALNIKPLISIGLMSYSLYLWHWPVLIFARQYAGAPLGTPAAVGCVVMSLVMAWLSWRWVEKPARNRTLIETRTLVVSTAIGAFVLVGIAGLIITKGGFPNRFSPEVSSLISGSDDFSTIATSCGVGRYCHLGIGEASFILAGDSHAGALSEAVDYAARARGVGGELNWVNTCPALLDWTSRLIQSWVDRANCLKRNAELFDRLRHDSKVHTLILAAYWRTYMRSDGLAFLKAVRETVKSVRLAGKNIIILKGIPEPGVDMPWALAIAAQHHWAMPSIPYVGPEDLDSGATELDLSSLLCPRQICLATVDGRPLYKDSNHLTREADLKLVGPYLAQVWHL